MRKLLFSAMLAAGLTLTGVSVVAAGDNPMESEPQQQMKEEQGQQKQMNQEQQPEAQTQNKAQGQREYTVKKGDTLSEIAKQELGSAGQWKEIAKANGLENPNQLKVGQRLIIPSKDTSAEAEPDMSQGSQAKAEMTDEGPKGPAGNAKPAAGDSSEKGYEAPEKVSGEADAEVEYGKQTAPKSGDGQEK